MKLGTKILLGVLGAGALVGGYVLTRKRLPPSTEQLPPPQEPIDTSRWMLTPVTTTEAQSLLKRGASLVKTSDLPPNLVTMLEREVGDWGLTRPTVHTVMQGSRTNPYYVYVADFSHFSKTANWIIAEPML